MVDVNITFSALARVIVEISSDGSQPERLSALDGMHQLIDAAYAEKVDYEAQGAQSTVAFCSLEMSDFPEPTLKEMKYELLWIGQ